MNFLKKTLVFFGVFALLVLANIKPVYSFDATESGVIKSLETQIQDVRSESYQNAIKTAENAGNKADRLLDWLVAMSTIGGIFLTLFIFIVGGSFINTLRVLNGYADAAKKSAIAIDDKFKQADEIYKNMQTKNEKITDTTKNSKAILEEQKEALNEIKILRNSANFISNATPSYPSGTVGGSTGIFGGWGATGPTGPSIGTTISRLNVCRKCGRSKLAEDFSIAQQYSVNPICKSCERLE